MLFSILEEVKSYTEYWTTTCTCTNLLAKGTENATLGTEEILLHFRVVAILNKKERRSLSDLKLEEKPCLTRNLHDRAFDTMEPRQELKLSYQKEKYETTTPRWKTNMRLMQHRIKDRFRVAIASHSFLKQKSQMPGGIGTPAWRATATGLVVARVFQDNSVMARVARSMAKREWQKRSGWLNAWTHKFRSMLGLSVNGGALSSEGETSLAEALMLQPLVGEMDTTSVDRKGRRKQLELYEEKAIATANEHSLIWRMLQAVMLPFVANSCRVFMHCLNSTEVYGVERLHQAVWHRPQGQALITVCNHVASMDDPLVMSTLLPHHMMLEAPRLRWTLCATDQCFSNPAVSAFFHSMKCLPVKRGGGLQQEGLDIAVTKLRQGEWVHIFPEGGRSRDGGRSIGNLKRGIGRLVAELDKTPLVIPFVHSGMQDVMPIGSKIPATHKKVTVLVGQPIQLDDLVSKYVQEGLPKPALYDAVALRVRQNMKDLKEELEHLVLERDIQDAGDAARTATIIKKLQAVFQFVDWEAQGFLFQYTSPEAEREISLQVSNKAPTTPQESSAVELQEMLARKKQLTSSNIDEEKVDIARVPGFSEDPLSFLGLGFAARGLLSSRMERLGTSPTCNA